MESLFSTTAYNMHGIIIILFMNENFKFYKFVIFYLELGKGLETLCSFFIHCTNIKHIQCTLYFCQQTVIKTYLIVWDANPTCFYHLE